VLQKEEDTKLMCAKGFCYKAFSLTAKGAHKSFFALVGVDTVNIFLSVN